MPPYPPQPGWAPQPPPCRRRWGRVLVWVVALPVLGIGVGWGVVLVREEGGGGDAGACKAALAENYREAVAAGPDAPSMGAPASCAGLSGATLERITGEVVSEYLDSDEAAEDLERAFEEGMASATASP